MNPSWKVVTFAILLKLAAAFGSFLSEFSPIVFLAVINGSGVVICKSVGLFNVAPEKAKVLTLTVSAWSISDTCITELLIGSGLVNAVVLKKTELIDRSPVCRTAKQ